ncbi:putative DNase [Escherichia coli]|nr:putative DNase [Escherichia coli]STL09463.1 putative DNase [Escherichia coli]
MAVLRTLPGRIKTLNTRRINVLRGNSVVSVAVPGFPSNVVSGGGMPDTVVSVDAWLTFVTVNSITALHFSSVVVMRRRTSGPSVLNAIARSQRVKRRVVCLIRRCLSFLMARSGPTESLACDQTRGGSSGEKKRSPWTPRPLSRREKIPVSGQLTC